MSQKKKTISSSQGDESALWMNEQNNEESREVLCINEFKGVTVTKQAVWSAPASHVYSTFWVIEGGCQANFALQAEFRAS